MAKKKITFREGVEGKACTKCNRWKSLTEYYKGSSSNIGNVKPRCKACSDKATAKYNKSHKKQINNRHKINRDADIDNCRIKEQDYRDNNRELIRETNRKAFMKYKSNPLNRIKHNMRCRIYDALTKGVKSASSQKMLGCTMDEYKIYLESLFVEGMSWDNYGDWHVDHIRPCADFDFEIISEQEACFHYSNTQPLWASDNFQKGDRL